MKTDQAIQGLLAYDLIMGQLYLGADYTHNFYNIKPIKSHLYWGAGGYFLFANTHRYYSGGLGVRLPFGFMHILKFSLICLSNIFIHLKMNFHIISKIKQY